VWCGIFVTILRSLRRAADLEEEAAEASDEEEARAREQVVAVARVVEAQVRRLRRVRHLEFRRRLVRPISRPGKNSEADVSDSAAARRLCPGITRSR